MEKIGYLGIDVSKGYADFLLLGPDSQVLDAGFQLPDNKTGRQRIKELVAKWRDAGQQELYCGVESTGGYENNWYCYFKSAFKNDGVHICRINPRGVKAVGDAALKRTITDAVSAENIASYLIHFPAKLDYGIASQSAESGFREGRQHLTVIKMQIKQKVQMNNQLEKLLYQYFPELLTYCRHGVPSWLLRLLCKYPVAAMVIRAGSARLSAINGITVQKATALIAKAKENMHNASEETGHIIMMLATEILHKEELVKAEKHYLSSRYRDSREILLIQSIPGIGVDSAVTLALEIEDIKRFGTVKQLASFFGVHPTYKQSGDSTWGIHMSKAGRGGIRAVLYMVSLTAARCNPVLKETYARFRAKGMKHDQALGVIMHKILRMIYGILKNNTVFDAGIDTKNQERSKEKQKNNEVAESKSKRLREAEKYRYESLSTEAPISKRAERKIKQQIASQTP